MLHIKYRFENYPYIVGTEDGSIYQLEHCTNNGTKIFRKVDKIKCGGSYGYRINRNFISSNKMKELHIKVDEVIQVREQIS